jgi:signal transduction histidine kinase
VAYGIVHGLGGDIVVESPPGEGATLRVRLPRRPGALARKPGDDFVI